MDPYLGFPVCEMVKNSTFSMKLLKQRGLDNINKLSAHFLTESKFLVVLIMLVKGM